MPTTVADIIEVMDEIAPAHLAESWDNPGLQVGHKGWHVKKILVSLDPTPDVMDHAVEVSADMLITHHPLLFRPLKKIDLATSIGGIVGTAIQNTIAVYATHTNFDSVVDGLNDMLAMRLGLRNVTVLAPHEDETTDTLSEKQKTGLGRIGDLPETTDLKTLCLTMKNILDIESVRMVGKPEQKVGRVAVCTGSGSSLLERFFASDADLFITGDIGYHDAREVENRHSALIDIGHFGSEHIVVVELAGRLRKMLGTSHPDIEVIACEVEKDPFVVV